MRYHALALILAVAVPAIVQAAPIYNYLDIQPRTATKATTPLDRGYDALNAKQFSEASRLFQEAAKEDPKDPLPMLGLADVARLQNKDTDASNWVKKAFEVAPQSLPALVAMGRLSLAKKQWGDAERYFLEATRVSPNAVAPQLDLGELYLNVLHKPGPAVDAFRKASELKPDHAGARFGLGMALLAKQNPAEAATSLAEATRLAPDNPLAFFGLGQAEAARGDSRAAARAFDRAIALDPKFSAAMIQGAEAKRATGDMSGALALIDQAAGLEPGSSQVRFKQGLMHHVAGDPAGAFSGYAAAMKADPKLPLPFNNAAALAAERKERLDEALVWAKKACALAPNEVTFLDTLAAVHRARGERSEAVRILEKIAASEKPPADSLYQLGLLRQEAGQSKEAVQAYRRALQTDPSFAGARDAKSRIDQLEPKR